MRAVRRTQTWGSFGALVPGSGSSVSGKSASSTGSCKRTCPRTRPADNRFPDSSTPFGPRLVSPLFGNSVLDSMGLGSGFGTGAYSKLPECFVPDQAGPSEQCLLAGPCVDELRFRSLRRLLICWLLMSVHEPSTFRSAHSTVGTAPFLVHKSRAGHRPAAEDAQRSPKMIGCFRQETHLG
jgi:hypothetical protein